MTPGKWHFMFIFFVESNLQMKCAYFFACFDNFKDFHKNFALRKKNHTQQQKLALDNCYCHLHSTKVRNLWSKIITFQT